MSSSLEPDRKPSLEALLRVKRAEQPDAAFWTEFERGMRQKQLAAIMEPKPWWLSLSILGRKHAPLVGGLVAGAAAVLFVFVFQSGSLNDTAVTVGSLPSRQSPEAEDSASTVEEVKSASVATNAAKGRGASSAKSDSLAVAMSEPDQVDGSALVAGETSIFSELDLAAFLQNTSREVTRLVAATSNGQSIVKPSALTSADWGLAANLTGAAPMVAEAGEVSPDRALGFMSEGEVEMPAANPRQARLLAGVTDTTSSSSLAHVRDRVLHRMDDSAELYASISRLGVSGDRLSLKF